LFGGYKSTIYGVNYFGAYNPQTTSDYCGLIPFTFIPLAFLAKRNDRVTVFWLCWLVFAFLMALGDAGVVARLIYLVPVYNKFRAPSRHLMEFTMAVSVLTAIGASSLTDGGLELVRKIQKVVLYFLATAAIFAIAFASALQRRVAETDSGTFGLYPWNNIALGLPIALIIIWAFVFKFSLDKPKFRWHCLLLFTLFDLSSFALGAEYIADSKPASIYTPPPHAVSLREDLEKTHQRLLSLRGNSGSYDELPVDISMLWNVPNATMYESLMPQRMSQLLNIPEGGFVLGTWANRVNIPEGGFLLGDWSKPGSTVFDTLAVKYVLLPRNDRRYPAPKGERWRFVQEAGEALVYENMRALPRAWLVPTAIYMTPEKMLYVLQGINNESADPHRTVLLEGSSKQISFREDPAGSANVVSLNDTEMIVNTKSQSDAFLVTSDAFYPGWEVEIDGKPAQLLCANYVVRAVLVPQGNHVVKFAFKPQTLRIGIAISCAALLIGMLIGLVLAIKQRSIKDPV
jgi:Bacterial membrane protein YfhO